MKRIRKISILIFLCVLTTYSSFAQLTFSMQCASANTSITCTQTYVTYYAVSNYSASVNYTWVGSNSTDTGNQAFLFTPGVYTVTAMSGSVSTTQTLAVPVNTVFPSSTIAPMAQTITCNYASILNVSATAVGISTNIVNSFLSPSGGTFVAGYSPSFYTPTGPGTYTHFATYTENGCSVAQQFTVTSNQSYPTLSLTSPTSFTLGCGPGTVGVIWMQNGQVNPPAPLSYTMIPPTSSTVLPTGSLSGASVYTMITPGNYTAVVREGNTGCETRIPFTITQKTLTSVIEVVSNNYSLSCLNPTVTMQVVAIPAFTNVFWQCPSGNSTSYSLNATTAGFTSSYNVVVTGTNAAWCTASKTITVFGNAVPPDAVLSFVPFDLCNKSSATIFPILLPTNRVYTYEWAAPSGNTVSTVNTLSTTVTQPGTYTITVLDPQNQCKKSLSLFLSDCVGVDEVAAEANFRVYPNPARDVLRIESVDGSDHINDIEFRDVSGRLIKKFAQCNCSQVSLAEIPRGFYFIELKSSLRSHAVKLIVE